MIFSCSRFLLVDKTKAGNVLSENSLSVSISLSHSLSHAHTHVHTQAHRSMLALKVCGFKLKQCNSLSRDHSNVGDSSSPLWSGNHNTTGKRKGEGPPLFLSLSGAVKQMSRPSTTIRFLIAEICY